MDNLIGLFIFHLQANGTLDGQWMNNATYVFQNEIAVPTGNNDGFFGAFRSSWTDESGDCIARLTIREIREGMHLEWVLENSTVIFDGIGTLDNGRIIGGYRNR